MKLNEWIYFRLSRPVVSFFINLWIWINNLVWIEDTEQKKERASERIKRNGVQQFLDKFDYSREKIDWKPWPSTLFFMNFVDDCDGAAVMAQWAWKQIGVKSDIYHLRGDGCGHAICVTKDKEYFASNGNIFKNYRAYPDWERDVLEHFKFKYGRIFK